MRLEIGILNIGVFSASLTALPVSLGRTSIKPSEPQIKGMVQSILTLDLNLDQAGAKARLACCYVTTNDIDSGRAVLTPTFNPTKGNRL